MHCAKKGRYHPSSKIQKIGLQTKINSKGEDMVDDPGKVTVLGGWRGMRELEFMRKLEV